VETLLVVGEPYFKSLETASRSFAPAKDLGIAAVVPYDEAVVAADERGVALIEHEPAASSVAVIRRPADELLGASAA
jgi:CO dehydrogenase nickel-insertion accessory protein CooC1